jgi:hypothetical protein
MALPMRNRTGFALATMLLFSLVSLNCKTITFGLNPAGDAGAFLDAVKQSDSEAVALQVTESSAEELKALQDTLDQLQDSGDSNNEGQKYVNSLTLSECFVGSETGLCKLSNGTELLLQKSGLGWKVDLTGSTFQPAFQKDMAGMFRGDQSPEQVTIRFMTALLSGDLEQAQEYSTSRTHLILPLVMGMMTMAQANQSEEDRAKMEQAKKDLETMKCRIDGDTALCAPQGKDEEMDLIRENGVWKVDMKKNAKDEESDGDEKVMSEEDSSEDL